MNNTIQRAQRTTITRGDFDPGPFRTDPPVDKVCLAAWLAIIAATGAFWFGVFRLVGVL